MDAMMMMMIMMMVLVMAMMIMMVEVEVEGVVVVIMSDDGQDTKNNHFRRGGRDGEIGGRGEKRQKPGKWEAARGEIFKSHCIIEEREGEGERERETESE